MKRSYYLVKIPNRIAKNLACCSLRSLPDYVRTQCPRAWDKEAGRLVFSRLGEVVFTFKALTEVDPCGFRKQGAVGTPFFKKAMVQQHFQQYVPHLVKKEQLEELKKLYEKGIVAKYQYLLWEQTSSDAGKAVSATELQEEFFRQRLSLWSSGNVLNLDPKVPMLTQSEELEYEVYDVGRLLDEGWDGYRLLFVSNGLPD